MSRAPGATREQGIAVLSVLLVLLLVGTYFMLGSVNLAAVQAARERASQDALLRARDALVAYAVSDDNRPGELPCPDINNDGKLVIGEDLIGSSCAALVGRLPWITLGLPDLYDDAGERLWYALSNDFHANGSVPLNSDTAFRTGHTSLSVAGAASAGNLVAVVLAPGATLARPGSALQDRTSAAAQLDPVNYLDAANGIDNADADTSFVSAPQSDTFNDRLLPIHSDDIMRLVERRAGRELAQKLRDHYDAWQSPAPVANTTFSGFKGFYPWAAPLDDPSSLQPGVNGTTSGQLPMSPASVLWNAPTASLGLCAGANTTQIQCTAASLLGLLTINGRVRNVGTALIDPPAAANVSVAGIVLGQQVTWTLNAAAQALDFQWQATILGVATVTARVPQSSAWVSTSWLADNDWHQNAFYALSPGYAIDGAATCGGAGPQCVTVAGTAAPTDNKEAVVLMSGRALPGQLARPVLPAPVAATDFLEEDNANLPGLAFENSLRTSAFNDQPVVVRP